ncbi:hypothetical protein BpHYR1_001654 [Brachionus plicatilis]|uniref:Uncharacterized protein n=1 Tax=Brachionus plicatilis TaxID=10195 RepID=A0A3M7SXX7_BRAPC|nr:hypothetical protein BpHYR1_001654 [Brachionus plicatilis]
MFSSITFFVGTIEIIHKQPKKASMGIGLYAQTRQLVRYTRLFREFGLSKKSCSSTIASKIILNLKL